MIKHATIKDLAQALGISKSTVSRALADHSDVKPETKRLVLEMAEKMNYRPNPYAQNLIRRRSKVIGVVVPEFVNSFFPRIIIQIQKVFEKEGFNVLIEECVFENMLDDATNVHGSYVRVTGITAPDQVIARINHPQQAGYEFAGKGDEIDVVDAETLLAKHTLRVKKSERINAHYIRLTFTAPVEGRLTVGDGLENMSWYPELIFRNNVVRNNRARSILVSTPRKVVVEGNTFSSMMSAILFEGDMDHWYESGAVRDVTIRNNRFLDGTYGGADFPTIFINPHQKKEVPGHPYERNITIEGNLFRTFNEQLLRAKSVGGLIFRDNTIELSEKYKPYNDLPTIDIRSSQQVVIENNRYKKPGKISIVRK